MSNTVFQIKRSSVAGRIPVPSDIDVGELAINLTDKVLYSKDGSGSVFAISSGTSNVVSTTKLFPICDYGSLANTSNDAFGVSTHYTFDCATAGFLQNIDLNISYTYSFV